MVGEEFKFVQRPASHLRAINKIHCELYQMPAFEYAGLSQRANCQLSSPHVFPPRLARAVGLRKAREGALRLGARGQDALHRAAERSSLRHAAARRASLALRGAIQRLRRELSAQSLASLTSSSTFSLVHCTSPVVPSTFKTLFIKASS